MEYFIVAVVSLLISPLTLYSGFGLGTLLMPVFALFFSLPVAVVATAVVHGTNNVFKTALFGKSAERSLVLRFGLPAIPSAIIGAAVLGLFSGAQEITTYSLGGIPAVISPIKLLMAALIGVFALFELLPRLRVVRFDRKYLTLGGVLSGFFGGLSGHQGALRSAFLAKVGVSKEAFVGTNAVIGLMVDLARLTVYAGVIGGMYSEVGLGTREWLLIATGVVAAFAGIVIGKSLLHKVTMKFIQTLVGVLLMAMALALGAGIL
ncbi:MAG: sulfite exporter TauE/SafE family protein [Acidobacteria bacterium]|nr:sulfite exporter TauE/SafE family protein [Acidobacteriota bacterium]